MPELPRNPFSKFREVGEVTLFVDGPFQILQRTARMSVLVPDYE